MLETNKTSDSTEKLNKKKKREKETRSLANSTLTYATSDEVIEGEIDKFERSKNGNGIRIRKILIKNV